MAIQLNFTAPQPVAPAANQAKLMAIHKRREPWSIHVEVLDEQGRLRDFHFTEAQGAQALVVSLNKTNNSVKSEEQRVLEYLQANINPATGATYLPAGTYSGSPD